jgi:hypothetical protein
MLLHLRRFASLLLVVLTILPPMQAQGPANANALPVRRIMLYKHGVGYFERSGNTSGGADIVLEFKASEMNDVLKSLTLLDRSGGRVTGVSYESSDPINKQLENFGFNVQPGAGIAEVLDQFKGAKITITGPTGAPVHGSILGARRTQNDKIEIQFLTLLLDSGDIRAFPVTESTSLRLEDARNQRDLANYLTIVAGGQHRDLRALRIRPGTAKELTIGYVVEAPVWKSSYRLVFDSAKAGQALLQGWAIVDNPTNEDWKDVELSLVSGLPISFTQNLYAPHYMHRPEVALPFEMAVAPHAYEGQIFDREKKDVAAAPPPAARPGDYRQSAQLMAKTANAPSSAPSYEALSSGGGGGRGVVGGVPAMARAEAMADAISPATQGMELGELFEYRVDKRFDIPRHESAMIPFVQSEMKAERVLLFDPAAGRQVPFDAVLLTNTSKLTLDGGAITVLDGDRYLGEALIENMKPGENRPVSFAVDLGTRITTAFDSHNDQITSVKAHRGIITTTSKNVEVKTYTIRNSDDKARTLILQHPVRSGWKLSSSTTKPEETTAQNYRFRVALASKDVSKIAVSEEMEYPSTIAVNNLNSDILAMYVRSKTISPEAQQKLQAIVAQKDRLAEIQNRITTRQQEITDLRQDQDRLRQNINNLRGLPGQEGQVNSYAAKLATQEKTMEGWQASLTTERANLRTAQQELDRMMTALEI